MKQTPPFSALVLGVPLVLGSCSEDYKPVAASQCADVVKHSTKILGKFAKPKNEMLRQCQNATDVQRGCVMQAKIVADLSKCQS